MNTHKQTIPIIGLCGAHGTGKTTLLNIIQTEYKLPVVTGTIRSFYESHGIRDFDLLPPDVRTQFQKHLLLNQIKTENEALETHATTGFVNDRTVIDYIGYAKHNSTMHGADMLLYETLIKERLTYYTHIIYCPVEFEAPSEYLRANPTTSKDIAAHLETFLDTYMPGDYLRVTGSVEERMEQIRRCIR